MTLGFTDLSAGDFRPVWAVDNNRFAVETYNANFGSHCENIDIVARLEDKQFKVPEADIVIGGPPCQGFSLLNKNRDNDPRKQLWRPFMDVVKRSGASMFLMENVPQLLNTDEHLEIEVYARQLGFQVESVKLCAADYGAPQTRYRAFIFGASFSFPEAEFPPLKTHYNPRNGYTEGLFNSDYIPNPEPWVSVRDAIGKLRQPIGTQIRAAAPPYDLHFGRSPTEVSIKRYKAIPNEGMNRFDLQERAPELTPRCWINKPSGGTDLFGRLWWDRPAFTIRTEFYKPEKGRYLHPQQHRPITHREAARFQSFPDYFSFEGTKIEIAKQIGNAVPPALARAVADSIYKIYKRHG